MNPHQATKDFEKVVADYCGAKYFVATDNCSNAIFISLLYVGIKGIEITIPERTYPSAPCEIIFAGGKVKFSPVNGFTLKGAYQLKPTPVWDSALLFSADMYIPGQLQCVSFSGAYKNLKLGKGGGILTDDENAYNYLRRARYSGRGEVNYNEDDFFMLGKNCYMLPSIAANGILLMNQFYSLDGAKKKNEPIELPYPKLSNFSIFEKTWL